MALRRTLEMLESGQRIGDRLLAATTRNRPPRRDEPRPLDPWAKYRPILEALIAQRPAGT